MICYDFRAVNNEQTPVTPATETTATTATASSSQDMDFEDDETTQQTESSTQQTHAEDSLLIKKIYLKYFIFNKRCLLAYHRNRLEQLKKLRWDTGALLSKDIKSNLSEHEVQWFLNYSKNLSDYMGRLNQGQGLDLTVNQRPPKALFVRVRILNFFLWLQIFLYLFSSLGSLFN